MRWTLRHKANAAILITFLMIAVISIIIQLSFQQKIMKSALEREEVLLESLVERDQESLANEIFEGRTRAIQIRLAQMCKVRGILNICVFDKDGRLLVSEGTRPDLPDLSTVDVPAPAKGTNLSKGRLGGQDTLVYVHAIEVIRERIGYIRIHYSLADIEKHQRMSYLFLGGLLGAVFITMLVLLNYIISRVVINPITSLRDAMQRINSGVLGSQVEVKSPDEIGDLTRTFNQMSRDLALYYRQIEEQNMVLKESEKRLSDERERLDVTLRSIADGVIATDSHGMIVLMNHSAETLTGHPFRDAFGSPLADIFHIVDEGTGNVIEILADKTFQKWQPSDHSGNAILIARDGSRRSIACSDAPIIDNEGAVIGDILVFQDITGRRMIEAEMTQMRVYLKNIIDSMLSMLISVNDAGIIVEWNQAAYRSTGVPPEMAIGSEVWKVLPLLEKYRDSMKEVILTRSPREFHRVVSGYGEMEVIYNISLFPLIARSVQGVVIRMDNITDIEKKEQQLIQAQKMETIGTLAGGLAHDFNNILAGITGSLSLVKFKLMKEQDVDRDFIRKYIDIMEEAGKRAADLVKQLLSISRKQEMLFEPVDLVKTMDHVMQICSNSFDKSIELDFQVPPGNARVYANPTHMEQVLLNLCVNGAHAMTNMRGVNEHQGGKLSVSLRRITADRSFCLAHPDAKELTTYWMMTVQDGGVGMDPRTVAKIYDPFFTTKDKDKGTGLGLVMVYNIVRQHGGLIDVYSEPGIGSTFNVYIPEYLMISVEAEGDKEPEIFRGQGLVLVVDDERVIRENAGAILRECGYDVISASDGEEAVRVFQNRCRDISAVLLDMIMPKMSGKDAYLRMKEISPDIKVLFSSGFKQDERVESVLELGVQGFVQKPYTLQDLSVAMHKVIHS